MMITNFGCLLTNNSRSKAYLQKLVANELAPAYALVVTIDKKHHDDPAQDDRPDSFEAALDRAFRSRKYFLYGDSSRSLLSGVRPSGRAYRTFDPDTPVTETLDAADIPFDEVHVTSMNDPALVERVTRATQDYFLFSGGGILHNEMLSTGKKFIHIHPGWLPNLRGSMCVEWSALLTGQCGVSAIIMAAGIDEGDIVHRLHFPMPCIENGTIASLYSAHIRSEMAVIVARQLKDHGELSAMVQSETEGRTHYMMHPAMNNIVLDMLRDVHVEDGRETV